jgi:hypothetical protein
MQIPVSTGAFHFSAPKVQCQAHEVISSQSEIRPKAQGFIIFDRTLIVKVTQTLDRTLLR